MFLGYSEKDETLLKQHNNVTVLDAVSSLDNFMREEVNNQVRSVTVISSLLTVNSRWTTFQNCHPFEKHRISHDLIQKSRPNSEIGIILEQSADYTNATT